MERDDGWETGGPTDEFRHCRKLKGVTKGEFSPWSPLRTVRSGNCEELVRVRDWIVHTGGASKDGPGNFRRDVLLVFKMCLFFCRMLESKPLKHRIALSDDEY
jgi:hypothetical protein